MDILLYARGGENEELRYAVRTWCENLKFDKLFAVGGPFPRWFKPDVLIENPATLPTMAQCYDNLIKGLSHPDLSANLLVMMDDVFILDYVGKWTTNLDRGTLDSQYKRLKNNGPYAQLIHNTDVLLCDEMDDPLSYESHAPFLCEKSTLLETLEDIGPDRAPYILWRSVYGNRYDIPHEFRLDAKLKDQSSHIPQQTVVISTNESSWRGKAGKAIENWFPYKSKYEL